jgi:hypothetical protein
MTEETFEGIATFNATVMLECGVNCSFKYRVGTTLFTDPAQQRKLGSNRNHDFNARAIAEFAKSACVVLDPFVVRVACGDTVHPFSSTPVVVELLKQQLVVLMRDAADMSSKIVEAGGSLPPISTLTPEAGVSLEISRGAKLVDAGGGELLVPPGCIIFVVGDSNGWKKGEKSVLRAWAKMTGLAENT